MEPGNEVSRRAGRVGDFDAADDGRARRDIGRSAKSGTGGERRRISGSTRKNLFSMTSSVIPPNKCRDLLKRRQGEYGRPERVISNGNASKELQTKNLGGRELVN